MRNRSNAPSHRRRPAPRTLGMLSVLASIGLLISACASSGGGSTNTNSSLKGEYTVMVLGPFSSGGSELAQPIPEIKDGALAAAKEINDAGGVNGKAINVEACDSEGNPNKATQCADQAVTDKVVAVIGSFDTVGDYLAPLEQAKIPLIAPNAIQAESTSPISYPVAGGQMGITGAYSLLAKQGIKDIAVVSANVAALNAAPSPAKITGTTSTSVKYDPNTVDFSSVAAKAATHQGIVVAGAANKSIAFITALRRAGYKTPVAADTSTLDPTAVKSMGNLADGLYLSGAFLPGTYTKNAAVAKFAASMKAIDANAKLDDGAMNAYVGIKLFANVIKGMSDVTPATVTAKLNTSTHVDAGGLIPAVDFSKSSPAALEGFGITRAFRFSVVYSRVENGVITPLTGTYVDAATGKAVQ